MTASTLSLEPTKRALILEEIRESPHAFVKVAVTDIDGILRGKYLAKEKFLSSVESGFGFCNVVLGWDSSDVCYDNSRYTGWQSGYPDALVRIDLGTYRNIPWENGLPFFLGEFLEDGGTPLAQCPRQLLKKTIQYAEALGYRASSGMEFEWFNFKETPRSWAEKGYRSPEPLSAGMFGYSVLRQALNQPFFAAIMNDLRAFRIPVEGLHTETGPGVYEVAIHYSDALECADRATLFKTSVKEIGYRFDILPTFMAKWNAQLPGSSGHIHQSLWSLSDSKNAFFDAEDVNRISDTFRHYIAGQLRCLPEILPLFAPTVNSYKRLVDGYWAPTKTTWGIDNRTTALRAIPGTAGSTRLETRVPGADVNPYLAVAASLASGLYGVANRLALTEPPIQGSAYQSSQGSRLPRTLQEATEKMRNSTLARELFGEDFVDHYVRTRDWEWRQFQDTVTQWELQRYLEII